MRVPRRPELRACGIVLTFVGVLLWPRQLHEAVREVHALEPSASSLWLAPVSDVPARSALAGAVGDLADGRAAAAASVFLRATRDEELGGYARLYLGRSQLALGQMTAASETARQLVALQPPGYLGEAALWLDVEVAEAASDWPRAIRALQTLAITKSLDPEQAWLRLGYAAVKANDTERATRAFRKVYYEYPLSIEATDAANGLAKQLGISLPAVQDLPRELDRADSLFAARRWNDSRTAYAALAPLTSGETRALVDLRLAAADYYLKRYPAARDALRALLDHGTARQIEAQFFYLSTLRELGRRDEYEALARAFVDANPTHPLAEETLNNLATHYILTDDDNRRAAAVFGELYSRFPSGSHADRAAWRAGWFAYTTGDYKEAARVFESAAVGFPRADYRPSWLYWAARAHAKLNEPEVALTGYRQVISSYRNSYYGRLALRAADQLLGAHGAVGIGQVSPARRDLPSSVVPGTPPANANIIRRLLAAGLYDDAIRETQKAQLEQGTSPMLEATIAYALNRKGELRPAITAMRRAYPQFMAEGGEALPDEIRRVIFPVAYWDVISREARAHNLDPYLMVALVAQESTFQPDVRSAANAWGLMQIEPATGRQYASKLHIRPFSTARLTNPDINVRIGMQSFADRLRKFGNVAATLASYNAGDSRVARWLADRPNMTQDEFIDDIPFPETQNYVKRILGTADDYRILYKELKVR